MLTSGIGLHSGAPCLVRLHHEAGPVRFLRVREEIPAQLDYVVETTRSTTLARNGYRVATVEHLLAALRAMGWWQDVLIEVSADEMPILDGSAEPWVEAIAALGRPPVAPAGYLVTAPFSLEVAGAKMAVTPGSEELSAQINFAHAAIGEQAWQGGPEGYRELLSARTFGFLSELEKLREHGLATAASLDNAIVYGANGPLSPLRAPDEPVRHKALDALGDFYLLGRPLLGRLRIERGSHQAHVAFARALLSEALLLSLPPPPTGNPGDTF